MKCSICGRPFEPGETKLRKVYGWEGRKSGGGNTALRHRTYTNEYAHAPCVDARERATTAEQESLL